MKNKLEYDAHSSDVVIACGVFNQGVNRGRGKGGSKVGRKGRPAAT